MRLYLLCLVTIAFLLAGIAEAKVIAVGPIGMTVADMDRSIAFYRDILAFEKIADHEIADPAFDELQGTRKARARVVDLRLGNETLRLTQYLNLPGKPLPSHTQSNDQWFQHIAIVVRDMDAAYASLQRNNVWSVSTAPQTLPAWNHAAAGIRAYYFHDPDHHNLELIYFPAGKGDPRWQKPANRLFLGIDHTAIAVTDTQASLRFYRDTLGLRVVGENENYGPEQEHLNHVPGSRVRITSLRAPSGPGIEFLQYLAPTDGRSYPSDSSPTDLVHWQTVVLVEPEKQTAPAKVTIERVPLGGRRAALQEDPDGHVLQITEP